MPLWSIAATGMGDLLLLSRGDRLETALLSCCSCVPETSCQQQVGHVQLMLLSLLGHRTPGRQTCPARHSSRGPLLLGGAQQVMRDPHWRLDLDCERKTFLMGLRELGTPPSTPEDVARDLMSNEVQHRGLERMGDLSGSRWVICTAEGWSHMGESQEGLGQWDLILTRCAAFPGELSGDKGVLSTGRGLG